MTVKQEKMPIDSGSNQSRIHFRLLVLLLLSPLFPVSGQEKLNPNFDISGVREFWKIVEILKTDREPTEEQWQMLFKTPGYGVLIEKEFGANLFKTYFQAAYMPSQSHVKEELLENAKNATGWFWRNFPGTMLGALDWTLANREVVEAKMHSFETFPYTQKATEEALKYLPEQSADAFPNVAFIIFNDSRGYDPVVMSLNDFAKEEAEWTPEIHARLKASGRSRHWPHVLYFAHEFFHHFRGLKTEFTFPPEGDEDYTLVWLIDQIQNEGIADLINVKQLYVKGALLDGTAKAEREQNDRAGAALEVAEFNELLTGIVDFPKWKYGLSRQVRRTITRSGHVAGFYMANVILAHFPVERLQKVSRNPFQFFYLYNEAAQEDGNVPQFSTKAIFLIRQLEKKCMM